MVLGLVTHRVPRSCPGTRRQTGRPPSNFPGTVLLPYLGSLTQDVSFSIFMKSTLSLAGARDLGTLASDIAARALPRLISQACGHIATHGGTQSVAGNVDIRRLSEQRESTLAPTGAAVPGRRA